MNLPDFSYLVDYQRSSLTMIASSLLIGIIIASTAMLYRQNFLGGIVRNIIKKKALSEDTALTLEELGYNPKNIFYKFAFRNNTPFEKTVHRTNEQPARYYIPEEIKAREEIRYRKKGNNIFGIIFVAVIFAAAALAALTIIPWFKDALSNIFS
ncbi:MAG: hypothetical protein IKU48_05380 [Clostridia bacterium]|nr:hypothetical protein [Clostridia bacterium]